MSRPWGRWRARDVRRSGERPASCLRSGQLRACAAASFVPAQRPASCLRAAYTHEQHQVRQKHRRDGGSTNSDGRECLDSPLHTACDIERNSTFSFSSLHMAQPRNCYAWTEPRGTASKLLRLDRATWHSLEIATLGPSHVAQPRNCYAWTEPPGTASKLLLLDRATWHSLEIATLGPSHVAQRETQG
jgi:hypothetical protein